MGEPVKVRLPLNSDDSCVDPKFVVKEGKDLVSVNRCHLFYAATGERDNREYLPQELPIIENLSGSVLNAGAIDWSSKDLVILSRKSLGTNCAHEALHVRKDINARQIIFDSICAGYSVLKPKPPAEHLQGILIDEIPADYEIIMQTTRIDDE